VAGALGVTTPAETLDGWMPIRVHERGEPVVEWCWMDGVTFSEPFFTDTVELALRRPFRLLFRQETPIASLDRLDPGLRPSGFVLHGSRCGSTLVARMLAALPDSLVLSEPPPIDHVLRAHGTEAERVQWLRGIVSALGRPRLDAGRPYVLKLDAWATRNLATLRRAFPDVPCVFLFREPVQVLVSQFGQRGAHMVPGVLDPSLFGLDPAAVAQMAPEEYCARVLAAIYGAALEHRDSVAHFVDYGELPDAVFSRILDAFGLDYDEPAGARMRELAGFDAKNPGLSFTPEGEATDREAPPALREAADRWVRPVYEELLAC
jgi:hypothetical protein